MGRLNDSEKGQKIPLQTYYLNFPSISKYQCHAFTASAVSTPSEGPIFLFRRSEGKKQKKLDKEWTWELGALADKQAALSGAQPTTLDVSRDQNPQSDAVSAKYRMLTLFRSVWKDLT